jgi:hypothetical protein
MADMKDFKYRYIEETLEQDRVKFKPIPNVNLFLINFMSEATEGAGGDDNRTTRVGIIGFMQGILGTL